MKVKHRTMDTPGVVTETPLHDFIKNELNPSSYYDEDHREFTQRRIDTVISTVTNLIEVLTLKGLITGDDLAKVVGYWPREDQDFKLKLEE